MVYIAFEIEHRRRPHRRFFPARKAAHVLAVSLNLDRYLKDLTAQCELKAKEWDQRSVMRGNELKALEKAIDIVGPLSYRKFRAVEPLLNTVPQRFPYQLPYNLQSPVCTLEKKPQKSTCATSTKIKIS